MFGSRARASRWAIQRTSGAQVIIKVRERETETETESCSRKNVPHFISASATRAELSSTGKRQLPDSQASAHVRGQGPRDRPVSLPHRLGHLDTYNVRIYPYIHLYIAQARIAPRELGGGGGGGGVGAWELVFTATSRSLTLPTPRLVRLQITHISCGSRHAAAIADNGDMFTWGCNEFGQLGHHSNLFGIRPVAPRRVRSHDMLRFSHTACGANHTLALTRSGQERQQRPLAFDD